MIAIEKPKRLESAYQFTLQAEKLGFSILARPNAYTFRLQDRESEQELVAAVMAATFDFFEYRLNRATRRADLLIVQEHNAIAPVKVLCLQEARLYDPGVASHAWKERAGRQRRNQAETQMFLSRLLLSERAALQELEAMPLRTKQYYQAKMRTYLAARRGRPWSS